MGEEEGLEKQDPLGVKIHEKVELKKFDGVPPEHEHDPEKFGHKPYETLVAEDGKIVEIIRDPTAPQPQERSDAKEEG